MISIWDVEIPSTVNYNNNTYNVVSIGTYYTGELLTPSTLHSFNNESIVVTSEKVRTVTIPESVKTIYEGALSSKNGIDTGKTVKSYFQNHLENIFVDEDNKYFCSVDGVLYTKDNKKTKTLSKSFSSYLHKHSYLRKFQKMIKVL